MILQKLLKANEAILLSSWANICFITQLDIFSKEEREAYVLVLKKKIYLITDKRFSEDLKDIKKIKVLDFGAARFLKTEVKTFCKERKIKKMYFEKDNLTFNEHQYLKKQISVSPLKNDDFRSQKTEVEIQNLKKAARVCDEAFNFILGKIKKGVTEKEIALEIELFFRKRGYQISFNPIVAFGKHSSVPHHLSNNTKLENNEVVLLDFGARVNNYCSDITRTVFFGKPNPRLLQIYKEVLNAQKEAIKLLNSGGKLSAKEVDQAARRYLKQKGLNNFIHALGHGIGIEVHEKPILSPKSKDKLSSNMVFTLEPGIYEEGLGGIRIEDMVILRKGKAELISRSNRGIIEV